MAVSRAPSGGPPGRGLQTRPPCRYETRRRAPPRAIRVKLPAATLVGLHGRRTASRRHGAGVVGASTPSPRGRPGLAPGTVTTVPGRNGAGKSTLLAALAGQVRRRPDGSGRAWTPRPHHPSGWSARWDGPPGPRHPPVCGPSPPRAQADPSGASPMAAPAPCPMSPRISRRRHAFTRPSEGQRLCSPCGRPVGARTGPLDEPTCGLDYTAKARLVGVCATSPRRAYRRVATHDVERLRMCRTRASPTDGEPSQTAMPAVARWSASPRPCGWRPPAAGPHAAGCRRGPRGGVRGLRCRSLGWSRRWWGSPFFWPVLRRPADRRGGTATTRLMFALLSSRGRIFAAELTPTVLTRKAVAVLGVPAAMGGALVALRGTAATYRSSSSRGRRQSAAFLLGRRALLTGHCSPVGSSQATVQWSAAAGCPGRHCSLAGEGRGADARRLRGAGEPGLRRPAEPWFWPFVTAGAPCRGGVARARHHRGNAQHYRVFYSRPRWATTSHRPP